MNETSALPEFDQPDLARAVERLTAQEIDALPFGAIRIDPTGAIAHYSAAERRLSGFGGRQALGCDFFSEIAPCMKTANYLGRIETALKKGSLDLEFTHTGDFSDRERELTVRVQSASDGGYWIFMQRES